MSDVSRLTGLGLDIDAAKEQFTKAFILAIAAVAGCSAAEPKPDNDSIDWTLSCKLKPRRPKIDLQVKGLTSVRKGGSTIPYPLKFKNYDDLVPSDLIAPRFLVVVLMPGDPTEWLTMTPLKTLLKHSAYWLSLRGRPSSLNTTSVTVHVPRANLFDVAGLTTLMNVTNEGRGA